MTHSIAIIGAGPAGCYTAQALRKSMKDAEITVIDRLPVPYGLVRYGVAGDHQGTKGVTRQFARVFERQDVALLGNVELGSDVSLDTLRDMFDVVVVASGLYADRAIGAEGDDLDGIYGAGAVTRYWNGHPDASNFHPDFGRGVAVIGNGNVAMDIVRLLAKSEGDFSGSDIDPDCLNHDVKEIHVIGRSDLGLAKFDIAMVKELMGIEGLNCAIAEGDTVSDTPVSQALQEVVDASDPNGATRIIFHSGWVCHQIKRTPDGALNLELTGRDRDTAKQLACDSIVTAVGFADGGSLDRKTLMGDPSAAATGIVGDGLFVTGWFRRGPTGTIPENRADAIQVAEAITNWLGAKAANSKTGRTALLDALGGKATTYGDWLAIETHETAAAGALRCRKKVRSREEMLEIIEAAKG